MAKRYWGYGYGYGKQQQAGQVESPTDNHLHLPANCFTLGRFGVPKEGIVLSLDRGTDQFRPLQPHVLLGGYRIHRDYKDGCVYQKESDGKTAIMRRAVANHVAADGKRPFYTLKAPGAEKPGTTLVKTSTSLPLAKSGVQVNGRQLRLYTGVAGGTIIGRDGFEALVELLEGQSLTVFYEDGAVRAFRRQGVKLEELPLDTKEMLAYRIDNAWDRVDDLDIEHEEKRTKVVCGILGGMADLIHLTSRYDTRGTGQEMRIMLIKEFFLQLSPEAMSLVHGKLTAILHQVDPALLSLLRSGSSFEKTELPEGVVDITVARSGRDRAQREAARAAKRAERHAVQPRKTPRMGESKGKGSSKKGKK